MIKFLYYCQLMLVAILLSSCTNLGKEQRHFPPGIQDVLIANPASVDVDTTKLERIAPLVENSIDQGYYPGAIVLAGHRGQIIYRGVFGNRRIVPDIAPMQFNTIFDMASLTKVIVTTTAVMQLVEQKKLALDVPVAKYWPGFGQNGKKKVTVRELLTHTSGFAPDIPDSVLSNRENKNALGTPQDRAKALEYIKHAKLQHKSGSRFVYSDINFIVLGYLVESISGQRLNNYAQRHIFEPLAMKDSGFLPATTLRNRIAPTQKSTNGTIRWGEVNDPTTYAMGGVTGMAGLFSTAQDLGIFAQSLLNKGILYKTDQISVTHNEILQPKTIITMTTSQVPPNIPFKHGLGWDMESPYSVRGEFSAHSFGHTGWTGTSIWIDPDSQTWLIILTSRTHPTAAKHNKLIMDRSSIADMVAESTKSN